MVPAGLDLAILDDDARWADDTECVDLLFAGTWFLHETLKARHPKCPLLPRLIQMGDQFERMYAGSGADATKVNVADASAFFTELNTVGTLGHSLWRLKTHLDHPGLRYELKELSKVGDNPAGDKLRLRGQGFLLMAAGHLVKEGFGLEFIKRRAGDQTPDFFAIRDGNKFACEVTSRYPESGDFNDVEFFWQTVNGVVENKSKQLQGNEFTHGVLIIDCTPVWDAFGLANVPIGGQFVGFIPENLGGPRQISAPLVRYDGSPHSAGIQALEAAIRGTNIESVILWINQFIVDEVGYRRRMACRILGTVHGCVFWSFFPKTCVFPGPQVKLQWPD